MSAAELPPSSHRPPPAYAAELRGRVRWTAPGLAGVAVRGTVVRTSYGAGLLAALARDPGAEPRVGDRVLVRRWADGRLTLERVVARPVG